MGKHVLANGLNAASLRPLAKAASTSDRMLIYHFGSKDRLIAALLQHLAGEMAERLTMALPPQKAETNRACIIEIVALVRSAPFQGYMALWFDVLSEAGRGQPHFAEVGGAMLGGFLGWVMQRLPEHTQDLEATAAALLTVIEGTVVLDKVGQSAIADRAIDRLFPASTGDR